MRIITVLLSMVLMMGSSGCLFGGHSKVHREGNYVAATTLGQIQPGKTDRAWVQAVIGEPTERVIVQPGHEIWKYAYSETKDSSGYVFLIFGASDKKVTDSNVFIEFEGQIVTRTWRG